MNIDLIAHLRNSAPSTLKDELKRRYIPLLFQNMVVKRDSLVGKGVEWVRKWGKWDENRQWQAIFKGAMSSIDRRQLKGNDEYALYLFEKSLKNSPEMGKIKVEFSKDIPWVEEDLKHYSLLNLPDEGFFDVEMAKKLLLPQFPVNKIKLADLVSLFYPFFKDKTLEGAFEEALKQESALQEIVQKGGEVKGLAAEFAASLKEVAPGKPKLLFGKLLEMEPAIYLNSDNKTSDWERGMRFLLTGEDVNKVTNAIYNNLPAHLNLSPQLSALLEFKKSVSNGREFSWSEAVKSPIEYVQNQVKLIVNDFCEEIVENLTSSLSKETVDQVCESVRSNGALSKIVEDRVKAFVEKQLQESRKGVSNAIKSASRDLPSSISSLIKLSGFGDLGSEEQPFLLEFNRQQNGLFTLVMYVSGAAALSERTEEGKMRSTFIYKDIPAEKLNTEFFCCLYRYQSDKKVTYTFKDLLRGPFSQFGNPAIAKENGSIIAHETPGVWGILNEWMAKWHSLRNGDFRDQLKLNMRLKALVTLWHSDPQNVRVNRAPRSSFRKRRPCTRKELCSPAR